MQKLKYTTGILIPAVALCFCLSACGGGGGSGDNSNGNNVSNNTTNSTITPVSIPAIPSTTPLNGIVLYTASASYGAYTSTNNIQADSLGWLNNKRQNLGLTAFVENAGLDQSSLNHSNYLSYNQLFSHDETTGLPYYTGTHFYDRINQVFANSNFDGEVLVTWTNSPTSSTMPVSSLFDAPWHRVLMLDDFVYAGAGYALGSTTPPYDAMTMDLANYSQVLPTNNLLVYPSPGQSGVSTSWYDNETPDPFATQTQYSHTYVGYPITIQAGINDTLTISSMTLTEVDNGANVSCLLVDSTTSGENPNTGECTPYQPLKANTAYTVNAQGQLNGTAYNVTWSFGTSMNSTNAMIESKTTAKPTVEYNVGQTGFYKK